MRKGPDGKTIKGDEASEDATRKVPRRSIRDRLLAQEEPSEEVPPTHIAANPNADTEPGPRRSAAATPPASDVPPTVFSTTQVPQREGATGGRAPAPQRDYVPADPAPPLPATAPVPPRDPAPATRDYVPADAQATKIYRPNRPPSGPQAAAAPAATAPAEAAPIPQAGRPRPGAPVSDDFTIADPVVGWLVVTEGPGRGASLSLGYGNNRIGRAPTENISLDFGDEQISRENHATVTFDGRHRRFYVVPGVGRNLVYVNEQPVMTPLELVGGEEILLGQTKLRFVALCGKSFDWYQK